MYQVYLAFGYHNIYDYTEEQFEGAKKFYKLFQIKDNLWGNKRGDIFAWRKENKNANRKAEGKIGGVVERSHIWSEHTDTCRPLEKGND